MMEFLQAALPPGLQPLDAVAVMLGMGIFLICIFTWYGLLERDPLPKRIAKLEERRQFLKAELMQGRPKPNNRREKQMDFMEQVLGQFKIMRSKHAQAARDKLAQAGFRSREALTVYLFAKLVLPVGAALAGLLSFQIFQFANVGSNMAIFFSAMAVLLGAFAPDIYLKNTKARRLNTIRKALPDGYDLLVICAEAGLSVDSALDRVAREMNQACPELADELGLTAVELSFLPERLKALQGFTDRVPLPGVRGLVNTLIQTERYGTPLAQSLRVLSAELRNERMMRAEEKAARLPAIMTVPMVVFILPPLMIVLLGPAALKTIDALSNAF